MGCSWVSRRGLSLGVGQREGVPLEPAQWLLYPETKYQPEVRGKDGTNKVLGCTENITPLYGLQYYTYKHYIESKASIYSV